MASTPTWRLRVIAGTAVAITTLALGAACSKSGGTPTAVQTTTSGDTYFGGAPSASASASAGNTGGGNNGGSGNNGGGGNSGPTYPNDAKSYGLAFLQAVSSGDKDRIKALAVNGAVAQVSDGFYNNLNGQWTYRSCGPDSNDPGDQNKTSCVYDNGVGDEMIVEMNKLQLGAPTAVMSAQLDKTTYPSSPGDYVGELMSAYQNGNNNRVIRLSSGSVKGKLTCNLSGGAMPDPPQQVDGSTSTVQLNGLGPSLGQYYVFTVLTSPGGKANAVKGVQNHC